MPKCLSALSAGCRKIIVTDSVGSIYKGRKENMNKYKDELSVITNYALEKGSLTDVLVGSDVFIGVSGKSDLVNSTMIQKMNRQSIVFSLTNPNPEINPDIAKKSGATIVATGSYLYPNKVNNALVFPHLMPAILDKRIKIITTGILLVAAKAIANTVPIKELGYEHILPEMEDRRIQRNLSKALAHIS